MHGLRLPPPFELHALGAVRSLADEFERRAPAAPDGTLFVATEQEDARTRRGRSWFAPAGNLHCGIVIDCEFPDESAPELLYVGCLAAGTALAEVVDPQTTLRWDRPDRLLLNGLRAGRLGLSRHPGADDGPDKIVVALSVNVAHHPPQTEPETVASVHACGADGVATEDLLAAHARSFLRWINVWAEEGFEPVRRAWLARADGLGDEQRLALPDGDLHATFEGVGPGGSLLLGGEGENTRSLRLSDYLGQPVDRPAHRT